ncbi:hypothetical protein [Elioraea rosea]|uniref:hypothetical protein n=1 Tax=Elioraea rosea TaxID=2492390 RepID=UPI001187167A|nr:hypothetical protein [Elioraea rosea]
MPHDRPRLANILKARQAWEAGENVTDALRRQLGVEDNTPEIIELAYDMQAGSYIRDIEENRDRAILYAEEVAGILDRHIEPGTSLLDIGTGEVTTLSLIARRLARLPESILAFDISWSRVRKGLGFAGATMGVGFSRLSAFVAEIGAIPLRTSSVSITTSSHALEPNGGNLPALIEELFRVTRDRLILFEPSYEHASEEARARMDRLGYIRDLEGVVRQLGGTVVETIPIRNIRNPLNPTVCTVITPPPSAVRGARVGREGAFSVPGTDLPLECVENVWFSRDTGLAYPILKRIPILRPGSAILASALLD